MGAAVCTCVDDCVRVGVGGAVCAGVGALVCAGVQQCLFICECLCVCVYNCGRSVYMHGHF